jgi:hypothetical protein
MIHYPFWYRLGFLLAELTQAIIGIATLTFWRPCITMSFATWHNKRRLLKAMRASYGL